MTISVRFSCLLLVLTLGCILHGSAAKDAKQKLPSAMVVGTVYCDTCFHKEFSKFSHFISGASVAVECDDVKPGFRKEVKTNKHGVFRVRLPLEVGKHIKKLEACSVKLISSNEPYCAVASSATSSALRLKSRKKGVHVFSAGFFTFKPLKQPELCYQKPSIEGSSEFSSAKSLAPRLPRLSSKPDESPNQNTLKDQKQTQPTFFFPSPPIPLLPSPPTFGGIPFPPNPFQPPSLLPPNPLQPPPSVLPPLPFQPSPPPFINFPPIPLFTPPPPPPLFQFPTFPFPPNPLFPGIPPAFPSKETSP